MSTITALVSTDGITAANSMVKINTNFSNLNTDKIETSYLDTDTSLAANSDSKIATQKAVKTYIDTSGGANASETVRGIVEEATQAEVAAGTATGATGAKLFITPAKLMALSVPVVRQYLTAASPATWTKPSGLKYVIVEVQAAGGSGSNNSGATAGGGGGSGTYGKKVIAAASLGTTETVTIAGAGAGSGTSSFGAHLTCGNGGNAGAPTAGAAGAAASGADTSVPGTAGNTSDDNQGGQGAGSFMGQGGQGGVSIGTGSQMDGGIGSGYGSGGGGGAPATDGSPSANGGAATAGIVIVTEYYV